MGLLGRLEGNWPRAALMAACTSRAAASMLRLRSNCRTMLVEPSWLVEVISVTPAMRPNWRSSGVATADAMVSGLAPGRPAWTWIVGNSTWGRGATGRKRKASTPAIATARVSSDVVTGRLMKVEEITGLLRRHFGVDGVAHAQSLKALGEAVKSEINDGSRVEGEQLAQQQAAHDGDSERLPQLRSRSCPEGQRQPAQKRRHGGHHDRSESQQARLVDGLFGRLAFFALCLESEVNHHDGVLLDDADQQDDADQRDHAELRVTDQEGQDGADPGRGERGEDGHGMDVALIEHAEDDVDGDERSENQQRLVRERVLKSLGRALELGVNRGGQTHVSYGPLNRH